MPQNSAFFKFIAIVDILYRLTEEEIKYRDERASKIKVAVSGFSFEKELKDFDFSYKPGINKQQIKDLMVYLPILQTFLGHVDIQTTEVYAKYDTETKRKAIENAYPDLIQTNLPDWNNDIDLMKWLNTL